MNDMSNLSNTVIAQSLAGRRLENKSVILTGAAGSIGRYISRHLLREGAKVTMTGRDQSKLDAFVEELSEEGFDAENITTIVGDCADPQVCRDIIARAVDTFGKLDVLVNNAAVCYNDATLYGKVPYTPFEEQAGITVHTNFFGSLEVTRALLPLLRKSSSPRIINVASAAGRLRGSQALQDKVTSPDLTVEALEELMRAFVRDAEAGEHVANGWPNTCYGVSKLGLIALTRVLARDEPSIMVNSADPGYCATDQNNNQGFIPAAQGAVTPALLAHAPLARTSPL